MEMAGAVESVGTVDARHQLVLDEPLPIDTGTRVRVIVLAPNEAECSEADWLHAASTNPVFASLQDSTEDIYTIEDGKPFRQ
jgi:hypothetical protein